MKLREGAIISAYTGYLCTTPKAYHKYVEEIMDRPVYTHEFGFIKEELKHKSKDDFFDLISSMENDSNE